MAEGGDLATIALGAALFNNIVLVNMLGLCPYVGVRKIDLAVGIGAATTLVLALAAGSAFLIERHLLPAEWSFARPLVLIVAIAFFVQAIELCFRIFLPVAHRRLGVYLPLVVTNCAVLGIALLTLERSRTLAEALTYGAAGGAGFFLAAVLLGCITKGIDQDRVPRPLQGAPLAVITAGIMSLSVQGLSGLGQ